MRVTKKSLERKIETFNTIAKANNMSQVRLNIAYGGYRLVDADTNNEISWRVSCREMYYVLDSMLTYLDMNVRF